MAAIPPSKMPIVFLPAVQPSKRFASMVEQLRLRSASPQGTSDFNSWPSLGQPHDRITGRGSSIDLGLTSEILGHFRSHGENWLCRIEDEGRRAETERNLLARLERGVRSYGYLCLAVEESRTGEDQFVSADRSDLCLEEVHFRRANEAGNENIGRRVIELGRRPDLLDEAIVQDDDPIGKRHGLDLVM